MWKCKVDILSDLPSFENTKARLEMAHERAFLRNDEFRIQFSSRPLKTGSNSELDILERIYPKSTFDRPTSGTLPVTEKLRDIDDEDSSEDEEDEDSKFYEDLFGLCEEDSNTNSKLESVIIEDMSLTDDELEGSFPDFETASEDGPEENLAAVETIGSFTKRTVQEPVVDQSENGHEDGPGDEHGDQTEASSSHLPNSSISSDTDKSSLDLSNDDVIITGDVIIPGDVIIDDVISEPAEDEIQIVRFDIRSNSTDSEDLVNGKNDPVANHVTENLDDDAVNPSEDAKEENLDSGISSASIEEFEEVPRPILPPRIFRPVVTEDVTKNGHFKSPVGKSLSKMSESSGATSGYKSQSESSEYHYEESAIESDARTCCWLSRVSTCPNPFSFFATRCRSRTHSGKYNVEKVMMKNNRSGRTRNQSRTGPDANPAIDQNISLEFSVLSTDVGNDILPGLII